ncbi:hypothetical protein SMD44_07566 [Streptomyces alboflavus]|uniref:Uncharacterized protein n=1 Tax=Streptomyces alboflavus TaxID=67267 RepID=A0A1Z1WNU9_9ACTN|nr:hypothetical protein SMD44_07566 [Streptomyces alboflavus]
MTWAPTTQAPCPAPIRDSASWRVSNAGTGSIGTPDGVNRGVRSASQYGGSVRGACNRRTAARSSRETVSRSARGCCAGTASMRCSENRTGPLTMPGSWCGRVTISTSTSPSRSLGKPSAICSSLGWIREPGWRCAYSSAARIVSCPTAGPT